MSELRRFQRSTGIILGAALLVLAAMLLLFGRTEAVSGLLAGGLLGYANLSWMVGSAARQIGRQPTVRGLQMIAVFRFLVVGAMFGAILVWGRVNPIGAVMGYILFPPSAALAGWRLLGSASAVSR